jgi:hypothetical protein
MASVEGRAANYLPVFVGRYGLRVGALLGLETNFALDGRAEQAPVAVLHGEPHPLRRGALAGDKNMGSSSGRTCSSGTVMRKSGGSIP